ncbi:MAG TPA: F0F1 ATP synthase subunit epsilon [Chloroflexota bacterium]|nr:F0F1 ATP synthase subunit epsilon [Chloroflexota bacterium]
MPLQVEIVTAERSVLQETADMVVAPGAEGVLGILPRHAPMIALLKPGELRLKRGGEELAIAVAGGVMQVQPTRVVVLADAAERAEEIDEARAREAVERARQHMSEVKDRHELAATEAAIERATVRLRVAERRRRHPHAPTDAPRS